MKGRRAVSWRTLAFALPLCSASLLTAQDVENEDQDIYVLNPFEVSTDRNVGYMAADTLAGTRIRTDLRDVGSSVSVYTQEFLNDLGATDSQSLLTYAVGAEVGGTYSTYTGNGAGDGATVNEGDRFPNPNSTTRIRGLAQADLSRGFFTSRIPWDGFNIDRVDINRGANSILFGLGSPAGIINYGVISPQFYDQNEVSFRFGSYGSNRVELDFNKEIIDDVLAIRIAAVRDNEKFRQDPAFEDDERIFGAIKYSPKLVERGLTIFEANFERGDVIANRPRTVTPVDFITPWFRDALTPEQLQSLRELESLDQLTTPLDQLMGLGKGTFTPYQLEDDYTELPNTGQRRPNYRSGAANPYFNPAVGTFAQLYGGPLAIFPDHNSSQLSHYYMSEWRNVRGIGPDGAIDGGTGLQYQRLGGVAEFRNFAINAGLPLSGFGQYKNFHLQDASIFNFYDNLLDGPNKQERQDWTAYNLRASQTFFDNKLGFELAYDSQTYHEERWSMLSDQRVGIHMDINSEFADGSANPNVGRPFVSDNGQYGTYSLDEERDVYRGTVFGEFDFNDVMEDSLIAKILGRHRLTGLYSVDEFTTDRRAWLMYATDAEYDHYVTTSARMNANDNVRIPNVAVYLGDALTGRSSAAGANIPNIGARMNVAAGPMYNFNSTWNAGPGVDPAAEWFNPQLSEMSTQSENPANYVGWSNFALNPSVSEQGNRDWQTTTADLLNREIETYAVVWQGYLWDGAIVPTLGYRKDKVVDQYGRGPQIGGLGKYDIKGGQPGYDPYRLQFREVDPAYYYLGNDPESLPNELSESSLTRGLVVHVNDLLNGRLPFNLSLSYLESENFNPQASRRDVYGQELGPPTGGTEDYSAWIATKDNRFSFRVTKFQTHLENASSSSIGGDWFIGASMGWGGNWANIFEYDLGDYDMTSQGQGDPGRYTYAPSTGETEADAAAREAAAVSAFRTLQQQINPAFFEAWGLDPAMISNQGASAPPNFTLTESSVSEGYEFELTANPTPNWRVSLTASKVKSTRYNVGGEALIDFANTVNTALNETAAGDLRIWWGGAGNPTLLQEWNSQFYGNYQLKQLQEGTPAPEIREWNFSLVTNYSFTEGFLNGFNVGGAYRWQDEVAIGFPVIETDAGYSYDLNNPYYGPSEDFIDLWVGYQRDLTDRVRWKIQLNVRNLFANEGLIPISVQPDGETWAAVRIKPEQTWFLTNTFEF